jgi:hypothetical protein|nr:MAG TPA: hypothetical protein [Caudoviricetes sp.]
MAKEKGQEGAVVDALNVPKARVLAEVFAPNGKIRVELLPEGAGGSAESGSVDLQPLENRVAALENAPKVADKSQEVTALQGTVAEHTKNIANNAQRITALEDKPTPEGVSPELQETLQKVHEKWETIDVGSNFGQFLLEQDITGSLARLQTRVNEDREYYLLIGREEVRHVTGNDEQQDLIFSMRQAFALHPRMNMFFVGPNLFLLFDESVDALTGWKANQGTFASFTVPTGPLRGAVNLTTGQRFLMTQDFATVYFESMKDRNIWGEYGEQTYMTPMPVESETARQLRTLNEEMASLREELYKLKAKMG